MVEAADWLRRTDVIWRGLWTMIVLVFGTAVGVVSSAQAIEVQRAMDSPPAEAVKSDEVIKGQAAKAILRSLADSRSYHPYQMTPSLARRPVLEVAGVTRQAAAEKTPSSDHKSAEITTADTFYDWAGNAVANVEALSRAIAQRIIAVDTALLDNPQTVAQWLESMGSGYGGRWSPPEAKRLYQRYRTGTEFDKKETVAAFKPYLATQAVNRPMRLTFIRSAELGSYNFKEGVLPLRFDSLGKIIALGGPAGHKVRVEVENWNLPEGLSMTAEQARVLVNELHQAGSRSVALAATFAIDAFTLENDGRANTVSAKAVVERISLHTKDFNGRMLGKLLYEIPIDAPKKSVFETIVEPASDNLQSWTRLGVPSNDGRLLLTQTNSEKTNELINDAFTLLAIANSTEAPKSLSTVFAFAKKFGSRKAFLSLFPGGHYRNGLGYLDQFSNDPFKQKELVDRFNAELLPQIISKAPQLPIKLRIMVPVIVHGYDIKTETFSINSKPPDSYLPGELKSNLRPEPNYQLKVPETIARGLLGEARANKRHLKLDLAYDIEIDSVGSSHTGETRSIFQGNATAVSLHSDTGSTRTVIPLPFESFSVQTKLPPAPKPTGTYLTQWNLAALAVGLLNDKEVARRLVEASEFVLKQNEFGRAEAIERGLTQLSASNPGTDSSLFLSGTIVLGKYEEGSFGVAQQSFAVSLEPNIVQLDSKLIAVAAENSDLLSRITMDKDAAKWLVAEYPSRKIPVLYRVRPLRAEKIDKQGAIARLDLIVDELYFMDSKNPDRVIFSSKATTIDKVGKTALEKVPERLVLNSETIALLLAKHGGIQLSDASLRILLDLRWEEESMKRYDIINVDPAPWGRFFPLNYHQLTDADYDRLLPDFRAWTEKRLRTFPKKLVFESEGETSNYGFSAPPKNYIELLAKVGIPVREFASYHNWIFNDPVSDSAGGWKRQQSILGLRSDRNLDSRIDVYIPLPAIPSTKRESFARAVSLDMEVRSVFSIPNAGDGRPAVLLDVAPTEVRWYGYKSAGKPRELLARFPLVPVPPRTEVVETRLDILGLTIGMTQADAEQKLRETLAIDRVLELKGDPADRTIIAESARMYVSKDGADLVGVLYGPLSSEPTVNGVSRVHFTAPGAITKGQVLGALEKKYGPVKDPTNSRWRWGDTVDFSACSIEGFESMNWSGARVIEGKPFTVHQLNRQQIVSDPVLLKEVLLIRRLEFVSWGFAVQGDVEHCKSSISVEFQDSYRVGRAGENIPGADGTVLRTILFDKARRKANLLKAQNAPRPESANVDVKL